MAQKKCRITWFRRYPCASIADRCGLSNHPPPPLPNRRPTFDLPSPLPWSPYLPFLLRLYLPFAFSSLPGPFFPWSFAFPSPSTCLLRVRALPLSRLSFPSLIASFCPLTFCFAVFVYFFFLSFLFSLPPLCHFYLGFAFSLLRFSLLFLPSFRFAFLWTCQFVCSALVCFFL